MDIDGRDAVGLTEPPAPWAMAAHSRGVRANTNANDRPYSNPPQGGHYAPLAPSHITTFYFRLCEVGG
jgi:hypothetical protein